MISVSVLCLLVQLQQSIKTLIQALKTQCSLQPLFTWIVFLEVLRSVEKLQDRFRQHQCEHIALKVVLDCNHSHAWAKVARHPYCSRIQTRSDSSASVVLVGVLVSNNMLLSVHPSAHVFTTNMVLCFSCLLDICLPCMFISSLSWSMYRSIAIPRLMLHSHHD